MRNRNAKVGSQETLGETGIFGLGVQQEAGQRLIEFCQDNSMLLRENALFQQQRRRLCMDINRWPILKSD